MKISKNEMVQMELIVRITDDGRRFYRADLFKNWKAVVNREQDGSTKTSYEGEKVTTHTERIFVDDAQACLYYTQNFEQEYATAEEVDRILEKKAASNEARLLLAEFDYVITKLSEKAFRIIEEMNRDVQKGRTAYFDTFVSEMAKAISDVEQDKGKGFFSSRAAQRDIVNGL